MRQRTRLQSMRRRTRLQSMRRRTRLHTDNTEADNGISNHLNPSDLNLKSTGHWPRHRQHHHLFFSTTTNPTLTPSPDLTLGSTSTHFDLNSKLLSPSHRHLDDLTPIEDLVAKSPALRAPDDICSLLKPDPDPIQVEFSSDSSGQNLTQFGDQQPDLQVENPTQPECSNADPTQTNTI